MHKNTPHHPSSSSLDLMRARFGVGPLGWEQIRCDILPNKIIPELQYALLRPEKTEACLLRAHDEIDHLLSQIVDNSELKGLVTLLQHVKKLSTLQEKFKALCDVVRLSNEQLQNLESHLFEVASEVRGLICGRI